MRASALSGFPPRFQKPCLGRDGGRSTPQEGLGKRLALTRQNEGHYWSVAIAQLAERSYLMVPPLSLPRAGDSTAPNLLCVFKIRPPCSPRPPLFQLQTCRRPMVPVSRRLPASTSTSSAAKSLRCWGRTAPARPR